MASITNINDSIIGRGMIFPIELTQNDKGEYGWYPVTGDPDLIENNIQALIVHSIGQRFRQEDFGTRIWEFIEEPNTQAMNYLIKTFLTQAISNYESRIDLKSIITTRYQSSLIIQLNYSIKSTSILQSLDIIYDKINNSLNI